MESDLLCNLVMSGQKTATSSSYILYELTNEPLPKVNDYSVILDSKGNAICIIKNINVEIIPFDKITEEHAYKEGEGDKSLNYWKTVHEDFFRNCLSEFDIEFTNNMKVVYEEFELVYKQ